MPGSCILRGSFMNLELVDLLSDPSFVLSRTLHNLLILGALHPHLQNGDKNTYMTGNFMKM